MASKLNCKTGKMIYETDDLMMKLFVNRDDCYSRQSLIQKDDKPKKKFSCIKEPLTKEKMCEHMNHKDHLGVYQLRPDDSKVKWGVWDFDEDTSEDEEGAKKLYNHAKEKGFDVLAEKSKGGEHKIHLWIFSKRPVPALWMRAVMIDLCNESGIRPHEVFPKQDDLDSTKPYGNLVKLPLGLHLETKLTSTLLNDDWEEVTDEEGINKLLNEKFENRNEIPEVSQERIDSEKKLVEGCDYKSSGNVHEFDDFFEYVLNNELPQGISVGEKASDGIEGINSNILKNEAIWFFQKGYTQQKLTQEIKPIYTKMGWVFGDLLGWFKKAEKGDVKEISKGELIDWCKTYNPSMLSLFNFNEFLDEKDIVYKTDHLQHFDEIDSCVKLEGEVYKQMKKQVHYHLLSMAIPKNLRVVEIGNIKADVREHPLYILPSGKGKQEIKQATIRILNGFNPLIDIKEPRSIHKEQLIGKVLKRKEKTEDGKTKEVYLKKEGYLSSDLLIIEEAYELYNSGEKNDVDCRDILTVAMDIYGENLIQKQNIDNLDTEEETISYYSPTSIMSFSQPNVFREEFITKGLGRRKAINYKDFPERTNIDHFATRLNKQNLENGDSVKFANYMKQVSLVGGSWEMDKDAFDTFLKLHVGLLEQGFLMGGKARAYTKILEYPMQNLLLKMSSIRAISKLRTKILKEDVEEAFVDIIERFVHELLFVDRKVRGTLDYGSSWGGATGKNQECLSWLHSKGATSKESQKVYIGAFQKVIATKFDISPRRAKDRYKQMKQDNLIDDKLGQAGENFVWITFEPKKEVGEKSLVSPKNLYFELVKPQMTQMSQVSRVTLSQECNKSISKELISITGNKDSLNVTCDTHDICDTHEPKNKVSQDEIDNLISEESQ